MNQTLQPLYQAGGSLPVTAPSYVKRQADEELYAALTTGTFCYILNARQMGKSSLRVRMMDRLKASGIRSGAIDMTTVGTHQITAEQWYASILQSLVSSFRLEVNLRTWWRDRAHLSPVKRVSDFLETVLLVEIQDPIVVFIDEIDSVLGLEFPTDDFFALIRACYNQRVDTAIYQRLTFVLLGVATPSDLIHDRTRTPFNIGQAIELQGFRLSEALPLLPGLQGIVSQPEAMLRHILEWTGGQPFLTQKLCQLVQDAWQEGTIAIPIDQEKAWLDDLVRSRLIHYWELQDEPEHLRTIANRLLHNPQGPGRLLGLYQQMAIDPSHTIAIDNSPEQLELLLSGLVVKEQGWVRVRNPIYAAVFDATWVEHQLNQLRPYAANLREWLASGRQDDSRLLQGQALGEAELWADGKRIDDQDYQFLAASHALEQQKQQQALEAARTREVEARLAQERKVSELQRALLGVAGVALVIAISLGWYSQLQVHFALMREVQALKRSSDALFASNRQFEALLAALRARQRWSRRIQLTYGVEILLWSPPVGTHQQSQRIQRLDATILARLDRVLQTAVYGVAEVNQLTGHGGFVYGVAFSPNGREIATASADQTIKLWAVDGNLLQTIAVGHPLSNVIFSPDGQFIAAATQNGEVRLWKAHGELVWTWNPLPGLDEASQIFTITFSPDGQWLAIAKEDATVDLLQSQNGQRIRRLTGHRGTVWGVDFSPDGQQILSSGEDGDVKLWQLDGQLIKTLTSHDGRVPAVRFSPDGQQIASIDAQGILKLWNSQGELLQTIEAHEGSGWDVAYSPDGQSLVSTSEDNTLKVWSRDGKLLRTLHHGETIFRAAFSPVNSQWLVSAGADNVARLWRLDNPVVTTLGGHQDRIIRIQFSPTGDRVASPSWDKTIKLWDRSGRILTNFTAHQKRVNGVVFHPDGQRLASIDSSSRVLIWDEKGTVLTQFSMLDGVVSSQGEDDPNESVDMGHLDFSPDGQLLALGTLSLHGAQLRRLDGSLIITLTGHEAGITGVEFSPSGQGVVTSSRDGTARLWQSTGELVATLTDHGGVVWSATFSPDGQWVATAADDGNVKLWQATDGQLVKTLSGHTQKVYSVAFSPDGQTLASAGRDGLINLWNLEGKLIAAIPAHDRPISSVGFSPDGALLASGSWDKTLKLWHWQDLTSIDHIEHLACNWVRDYLQVHRNSQQALDLCN
jgi:WD40 repeat protein